MTDDLVKRLRKPTAVPLTTIGNLNAMSQAADRIEALTAENERLRDALKDLLEDTQHVDHNCGDEDCPVANARAALGEKQ